LTFSDRQLPKTKQKGKWYCKIRYKGSKSKSVLLKQLLLNARGNTHIEE